MIKSILKLDNIVVLTKEQQRKVVGSLQTWCKRRSLNVEDNRPGAPAPEAGFENEYGCWVYSGMSWNSHPNCPPGSSCYLYG